MQYDPTDLIRELDAMAARAERYSYSHLGIFGAARLRDELASLPPPVDLIALDIRKLHEINTVIGYAAGTEVLRQIAHVRALPRDDNPPDLRGQWGSGDEFVYAVPAGDGAGLLGRIVYQAAQMTAALSPAQREALRRSTRGLVDGIAVAAVLVEAVAMPLPTAALAIDLCNRIKSEGRATGERATSGAAGTVVRVVTEEILVHERIYA